MADIEELEDALFQHDLARVSACPLRLHATALLDRLRAAHTDSRLHAELIELLADTLAYVRAPDRGGHTRVMEAIERAEISPHLLNTLDEVMALNLCGETPFEVLQQDE